MKLFFARPSNSDSFAFKDRRKEIIGTFNKTIERLTKKQSPVSPDQMKDTGGGDGSWMNRKIRNPETGNDILVKTALGYDDRHPAKQKAVQVMKKGK